MADIADIANDHVQYILDAALLRHAPVVTRPSAEFCEECDEPIPLLRRQIVVGCQTCVTCQTVREFLR